MCGRYQIEKRRLSEIEQEYFGIVEEWPGTYNAAPSMNLPIARRLEGRLENGTARWGLVPFWAKDIKDGYKMINARAETVHEKPAFRKLLQKRRCLVPASGFYEWQKIGKTKQPWRFTTADGSLMAFAGLWDTWTAPEGGILTSFTIIVCKPNPLVSPVHDRMPVIVPQSNWERWLSDSSVQDLLCPAEETTMRAYPVSTRVGSPANDDPSLIEPIAI